MAREGERGRESSESMLSARNDDDREKVYVGFASLFDGISTFVGYLMQNLS